MLVKQLDGRRQQSQPYLHQTDFHLCDHSQSVDTINIPITGDSQLIAGIDSLTWVHCSLPSPHSSLLFLSVIPATVVKYTNGVNRLQEWIITYDGYTRWLYRRQDGSPSVISGWGMHVRTENASSTPVHASLNTGPWNVCLLLNGTSVLSRLLDK